MLGEFDVLIGLDHQLPDEVFDVSPYIAGFAELRGVTLNEGYCKLLGNQLDQICFSDAGRTDQKDIVLYPPHHWFRSEPGELLEVSYPIVVGADFCGENGFWLVLPDYVLVQIRLHLFRFHVEPYIFYPTRFLFALDWFAGMLGGHH